MSMYWMKRVCFLHGYVCVCCAFFSVLPVTTSQTIEERPDESETTLVCDGPTNKTEAIIICPLFMQACDVDVPFCHTTAADEEGHHPKEQDDNCIGPIIHRALVTIEQHEQATDATFAESGVHMANVCAGGATHCCILPEQDIAPSQSHGDDELLKPTIPVCT